MSGPLVLLTGFEPFGGAATNPSWAAVERLKAEWRGPADLEVACLPTVFAESAERLRAMIALLRPDLVIATGVAEGRAAITPEVIAINRIDARIPDNAGARPLDAPVVDGGPDGLFATLPVKAMVSAMRAVGVPAALSYSAGTFVCNAAFYTLLDALRAQERPARGGFIHVPATPDMTDNGSVPSMALDTLVRGLDAAILACLEASADVSGPFGTIA